MWLANFKVTWERNAGLKTTFDRPLCVGHTWYVRLMKALFRASNVSKTKPFVTVLEQCYLIKLRLLQMIAMGQMIYFAKFNNPLHECPRLKSTNTFKKVFSLLSSNYFGQWSTPIVSYLIIVMFNISIAQISISIWSNALYNSRGNQINIAQITILQLLFTIHIKSNVGFWGEGKTGVPGEKPLIAE